MDYKNKHLAIVYRVYSRVLKTNLNPIAILKSSWNKTILIQSSTPDANVQFPKMIYQKYIFLANEWNLEHDISLAKVLTELNLNYFEQYVDGTVKNSFDQSLVINERRNCFAGTESFFTFENLERRDQNLRKFLKNSVKTT